MHATPIPAPRSFGASRFGVALASTLAVACVKSPASPVVSPVGSAVVATQASATPGFEVDGRPFCFAGSSNYYPVYKPRPVVDDWFAAARALDFRVLRVWGMLDRGSLDGSVPNADPDGPEKEGVYFQYWDPAKGAPAYNDGANGLERLDYVLAKASDLNLKIIVVLINNWRPFGGVDQYLMWYGHQEHDAFFTAPEVKQAYKNWVTHVITRKNSVNGRLYRDDPTVFAWELANEPRMKGGAAFDRDTGWDATTLTHWADEMSAYVKSLDSNHLVSVGDEGFMDGGEQAAHKIKDGVDHRALTSLSSIDFGTFHLYPEQWGTSVAWGETWIDEHLAVGRERGKPELLEEYGMTIERAGGNTGEVTGAEPEREDAYRRWNDHMLRGGGSGTLAWMLAGNDESAHGEPPKRYPDYDRLIFYRDDATGRLLGDYARRFERAPACTNAPAASGSPSPYVRVRRTATSSAFGWIAPRG